MSLIDELNRELKPSAGSPASLAAFNAWMNDIFARAMQPPKDADKMTIDDDGECITIRNADGTLHAHYGPISAAAVRKYIAEQWANPTPMPPIKPHPLFR